jgi:hypothetical protein
MLRCWRVCVGSTLFSFPSPLRQLYALNFLSLLINESGAGGEKTTRKKFVPGMGVQANFVRAREL